MGDSIRSGRNASNPFGITKSNVLPLLVGSTALNMKGCQEGCVAFVRELLTVENCMTYFIFSVDRCLRDLREAVVHFLLNHIEEIQDLAEFRHLRPGQINYLIPAAASTSQNDAGSGDLVESEPLLSKLLFSFFKWWEVDKDGRLKDFTAISSKFPLTRVDAEVLRKIYRGDDRLRLDPTCKILYLETIESKFFEERSKSKGGNSQSAVVRGSASNVSSQISEVAEGAHEAEKADVNVQCVNSITENQRRREELLDNQSICTTPEVGARNSEEGQSSVVSGENGTTGSNPRKEQPSVHHPHAQLDLGVGVIATRGNFVGIEQNGANEDSGQQVVQICGERSVRRDAKLSIQTPGGNRGQKRPAQDDDVELLGVVPVKRNVIAEVDLTIADSDVDVSSRNATTGSPKPKLYFVSGLKQKHLIELDMTDFSAKKVADFPFKGNSIHLLYNAGRIYSISSKIINSNGKEQRTRKVKSLDLKRKIWVHGPNLKKARRNFAWTVLDNCLYVMGGVKSSCQTGSTEKLSSPLSRWECTKGEPVSSRIYHAVCSSRGRIYLVGGCRWWKKDSARRWRTSTVEVYEPSQCDQRGAWAFSSRLPESRIGHCVAAVETSLYVIGGRLTLSPGPSLTNSLVYSQTKSEWKDIAPLTQARQNFSAFVIDRHIYAVGGNEGPPTMERYDVDRDTWTLVEDCDLPLTGIYSSVTFALR